MQIVCLTIFLLTSCLAQDLTNVRERLRNSNATILDIIKQADVGQINESINPKILTILKMLSAKLAGMVDKQIQKIQEDDCRIQLDMASKSLFGGSFEPWVLQMIDSSYKINAGILDFNVANYGHPKECLLISHNYNHKVITGKYCVIGGYLSDFNFLRNFSNPQLQEFAGAAVTRSDTGEFQMRKAFGGICIPSACSAKSIQPLLDNLVKTVNKWQAPMVLKIDDERCYDGAPYTLTVLNIVFMYRSLAVILTLTITICTCLTTNNPLLKCFSLKVNSTRLFTTRTHHLSCLNGIRFLSICLVIYGHEVMISRMSPVKNNLDSVFYQMYLGLMGFFAVETFFALSGFLLIYQHCVQDKRIDVVTMYIRRYCRMTPVLASIILVSVNGDMMCSREMPMFCVLRSVMDRLEGCKRNWWLTLLYVQNYVYADDMCVRPSWYIAADYQLFLISPLLIYGLKRCKKLAITVSVLLILAVSAANGVLTYRWKLFSVMPMNAETWELYAQTHLRFFSWLIGALFGYIVANKIHLKLMFKIILWIFNLAVFTGIFIYVQTRTLLDEVPPTESALVNTLMRQTWTVALCCMIWLCSMGSGGVLNYLLSLPIFDVLSRVTYSMYLAHVYVIVFYRLGRMNVDYFNQWELAHNFFADLLVTLLLAIGMTLCIEMPFANLCNVALKILGDKREVGEGCEQITINKDQGGIVNPVFVMNKEQ